MAKYQNTKLHLLQFFRFQQQTTRPMLQRYLYEVPVMDCEPLVGPAAGCMRNLFGYTHRHSNRSILTPFLQTMIRSKHNQYSKTLGKNPSYVDIYRALKSPRSYDPFMGMQLGAVRLPPSFSFKTNKLKIEESTGENPLPRFKTMR